MPQSYVLVLRLLALSDGNIQAVSNMVDVRRIDRVGRDMLGDDISG